LISWRALLDEAQPLAVGPIDEEFLDRATAKLGGVKLPLRTAHRFQYPKPVDELMLVRAALEDAAATSDMDAHLLAAVLRKPLRAYQLAATSAYALLGAWRIDDEVEPRVIVLRRTDTGIAVDRSLYAVGDSQDDLVATMERLYMDLDAAARKGPEPTRRPNDHVLWIGGSAAEADDPAWRLRVEAAFMVEGFTASIRERPGRDTSNTSRAVSEVRGAAVICWMPRLGNPELAAEIRERSQVRVIELTEYDFGDAIDELRLVLDGEPLDRGDASMTEDASSLEFVDGGPFYFKKIAARCGGGDRVIHRREPCSHDSWTLAPQAPQARIGIEAYAGRKIRKLEHCDRCTGGGMWRVTFE
jgi:hypothetical protein